MSIKSDSEDDITTLLNGAARLIESVHKELSLYNHAPSTPNRSATLETPLIQSPPASRASSPIPLIVSSTSQLTLSRPSSREASDTSIAAALSPDVAREIERINRFCDSVDQNLRAIGVRSKSNSPKSSRGDSTGQNAGPTFPNTNSTPTLMSSASNDFFATPEAIIDLSESQPSFVSSRIETNNRSTDDDDVICIDGNDSGSGVEAVVVDLCTPGRIRRFNNFNANNRIATSGTMICRRPVTPLEDSRIWGSSTGHRARSNNRPNQLCASRRHLMAINSDLGKATSTSSQQIRNAVHVESTLDNSELNISPTNSNERQPYTCPVCMESVLNRRPTSTKCGHVFCEDCIHHAVRMTRKCPMCNKKVIPRMLFRIYL